MDLYPGRRRQLQQLIARLGLPEAPVQWHLLDLALTHPTISAEANYEQLEFMGDAVVRLCVAELLWSQDREGTVGQWSAIRAVLVSDRVLAEIARAYGFERFLLVGPSAMGDSKGELSRLANAFEAVLGALYLSTADLSLIQPWLQPEFQKRALAVRADPAYQNYKAALQQWTQTHYHLLPEYQVQEIEEASTSGADIPHRYRAEVWLKGERLGTGSGRSRKEAEKAAAEVAFLKLQGIAE